MSVTAESGELSAGMLRATQPAGAVFSLGWVMAELFDSRRRANVAVDTPSFDPGTQLPRVDDLAADPKLLFLAAELSELVRWFPRLRRPLRLVRAQTDRKRAAVAVENLVTAEGAGQAEGAQADDAVPDDVRQAEAAAVAVAAASFSETEFLAAVTALHQAILDEFADDPERLSAYQLGLALSDLVWRPFIAEAGAPANAASPADPASRPSGLVGLFGRAHLATVQTLLSGAGAQLPSGAATVVSRSLSNWADWLDVNSAQLKSPDSDAWGPNADTVLSALRVQGMVWRAVLISDQEVSVQPGMGAWVQAGASISQAARRISGMVLRRFWPLVIIGLITLGGLLYLVISNLSGVNEVWASLATVAAVLGSGAWGLNSGVSSALSGVGYEVWNAAKLDTAAWGITWLPALTAGPAERARLEQRGVAMPQIRKSLDVS